MGTGRNRSLSRAEPRDATEQASSRGFVATLLGTLGLLLGGVVALNLVLGERSGGSPEIAQAASEWQQRTRGVTYAPPTTGTRPFKILRLLDRQPEINGVLVGASTAMGVTDGMFPPEIRIYNFTTAGNPAPAILGEAEAIRAHMGERVKWLFVVLDWVVGPIYIGAPLRPMELSREAALAEAARSPAPLLQRVRDALTWPRVRSLGVTLGHVLRSGQPVAAFRQAFFQMASDEYRCADGTPARDFDTVNRGECSGYRYDGSWTYLAQKRMRESDVAGRVQAAAAPASKFAQYLIEAKGEPHRPYLDALAATARAMREQGGTLIVMLPPALPGLERALLASADTGRYLETTKAVLDRWARDNGVVVLDAGQSEAFGCRGSEFTDEHHAGPECFAKVMERFWRDYRESRVHPGLNGPG